MLLIFAGEGASDLGVSDGNGHRFGPMAVIVDLLIVRALGFSPIDVGRTSWISRATLSKLSKERTIKPLMVIPGVKREAGYAMHAKHAAALSVLAKEAESAEGDKAIAVIFRDSDGTQTTALHNWRFIVEAIESGFKAMTFSRGVVMVPKPKQEAWIICAKKENPYQHCALLEDESGNDSSPKSLKRQLSDLCGEEPDIDSMCGWIRDGLVDIDKIDMPSFNYFLDSMRAALGEVRK